MLSQAQTPLWLYGDVEDFGDVVEKVAEEVQGIKYLSPPESLYIFLSTFIIINTFLKTTGISRENKASIIERK